jgi:hypothetical protein
MSPSTGLQELQKPEPNGTAAAVLDTPHPASPPRDHHAGRRAPPAFLEVLALVALLAAYGVFLLLGTFVHTARLGRHFAEGIFRPGEVFVMLTCWTWTNLLILCCLASVIGELGRRVLLGARQAPQVQAALVRGFFILLAVMAGQLMILGTPAATAIPAEAVHNQELYAGVWLARFIRLAAFASLISLLASLRPRLIRVLMEHLLERLGDGHNDHPGTSRAS